MEWFLKRLILKVYGSNPKNLQGLEKEDKAKQEEILKS